MESTSAPHNPFLELVIIPGIFLVLAAGLHMLVHAARGFGDGEEKYRAWEQVQTQEAHVREVRRQSLGAIRRNLRIIDVDLMASFSLEQIRTLGLDLGIGALTADAVVWWFGLYGDLRKWLVILGLHLCLLAATVGYLWVIERDNLNRRANGQRSAAAILWGLLSMMSAFAMLR